MSDFDTLQVGIRQSARQRVADQRACEGLLAGLYQALRTASGPGLPLNNVTLDAVPDAAERLRPPPVGAMHAAWIRLGLCEVLVRVRRLPDGAFQGEFGEGGVFRLEHVTDDALLILARRVLREVTAMYTGESAAAGHLN